MGLFFNKIWSVLGVVLSASSIISLFQQGLDISLAFSLSELVAYYRSLVAPIFEFLYNPLYWIFPSLETPKWVTDAQILSIFTTSIYIKAKSTLRVDGTQVHFKTFWSKVHTIIMVGFTLIGLLFLPVIIFAMVMLPISYVNQLRWNRGTLKWYHVKKVLERITVTSGTDMAYVTIAAIYGYITIVTVVVFFIFNSLIA